MKIQKNDTSRENPIYMSVVCADIRNNVIHVSTQTMKLANAGCKPAVDLINEYKNRYPFFKVVVNDYFLVKLLYDSVA